MTIAARFHSLGRAIAAYDPDRVTISRAAAGNVFDSPHCAAAHLRHVWDEMVAHPVAGPLLVQSGWSTLRSVAPHNGSFWLGYHSI